MNRDEIAREVNRLLSESNVQEEPIPVFEVARAVGTTLRIGPLPSELSGFLLREGESTIIGVNNLHPRTRQNFTVAHELGHLRLHPNSSFVDRKLSFYARDSRSGKAVDEREIDANRFAAALLMPEKLLRPYIHAKNVDLGDEHLLESIARKFGVSTQALTYRLINLGVTK
ncbi:MAG TPA: ImmA/IrrE family metallo-endopeptidase [bacterium]